MKKISLILAAILLTGVAASAHTDHSTQKNNQAQDKAPGDMPPVNQSLIPDLPGQASTTAVNVTDTVRTALSNSVEGLGQTLSNLLGR